MKKLPIQVLSIKLLFSASQNLYSESSKFCYKFI